MQMRFCLSLHSSDSLPSVGTCSAACVLLGERREALRCCTKATTTTIRKLAAVVLTPRFRRGAVLGRQIGMRILNSNDLGGAVTAKYSKYLFLQIFDIFSSLI
jgi:hypothetical protein